MASMTQPQPLPSSPALTPHEVRVVAVEAHCDERTVRRYMRGDRMWGCTREAVRRAMVKLGHEKASDSDRAA